MGRSDSLQLETARTWARWLRGEGEGSLGHLGGASFKPLTSILSPSPRGEATETD